MESQARVSRRKRGQRGGRKFASSVLTWNVEGLVSWRRQNPELPNNIDLMVLTETMSLSCPDFPGFHVTHAPAVRTAGRPSGGLAVITKRKHTAVITEEDLVVVRVGHVHLAGIYHRPDADIDDLFAVVARISNIPGHVILAGDFNLKPEDTQHAPFLEFCEQIGLIAHVPATPTFISSNGTSTIDFIIISSSLLGCCQDGIKAVSLPGSRHLPVVLPLHHLFLTPVNKEITCPRYGRIIPGNAARVDFSSTLDAIRRGDTNSAGALFTATTLGCFRRLPAKKRNDPPWFDGDVWRAHHKVRDLMTRTAATPSPLNHSALNAARLRLQWLIREKRNAWTQAEAAAFELDATRVTRSFWRRLSSRRAHTIPIPDATMAAHFRNLLTTGDTNPVIPAFNEKFVPNLSRSFSEFEVFSQLRRMKSRRAPGPDGITIDMIRELGPIAVPPLTVLMNAFLDKGVPGSLKVARIVPLHKKGDPTNPDNYRGLIMQSHLIKLFSALINTRLTGHLETSGSHHVHQYGFRCKRSTNDALARLATVRSEALDLPRVKKAPAPKLFFCAVDFRKAFDSVPRQKLVDRLVALRLPRLFIRAIADMLSDTVVTLGGFRIACDLGVLQGDPTSPTLFVTLMDALRDYVPEKNTILYADDTSIHDQSLVGLQVHADGLQAFSNSVGLQIHPDKSFVMAFRKGGRLPQNLPNIIVNGSPVPFVTSSQYLGVILQPCGGVGAHLDQVAAKCAKATWSVAPTLRSLFCPPALARKIFIGKIAPIITYAAQFWGTQLSENQLERLDATQARFYRAVFSMPKSLATRIVLWMVGDVPISRRFTTNANHEPALNIPVNFVKPQSFVEVQPMSYFLLRGLHDRICSNPTCWRPKQWDDCDCSCRFCGERINGKFHVMECTSYEGVPWQTLAEATKDQINTIL